MEDLIEALGIFLKYGNPNFPTHCEHDILLICGYEDGAFDAMTDAEKARLDVLGFHWSIEYGCWASFLFGSA